MDGPLISCIVPVYNCERYVGEALESILKQSYRTIEIIVADDGSTDETARVIGQYGKQVRYLRQTNAGPAAARNLGLNAARGEFVAFLDADDLWHPEKLARQIARFQTRSQLDLCVTHVRNFWIPELKQEAEQFRQHRIAQPLPGYVLQAVMARRRLFDSVGYFNTALRVADSTEWFLRAAEYGAVTELLTEVLVYRRIHQSNLTRRLASASRSEYIHLLKHTLDSRRRQKVISSI
jgi:glycosyltransferase involved in cell wall biosynthesis